MPKKFQNPDKHFVEGSFNKLKHPKSPSPKRKDYNKRSLTKDDKHSRCTYIHSDSGKRCKLKLGLYPTYCHLHKDAIKIIAGVMYFAMKETLMIHLVGMV